VSLGSTLPQPIAESLLATAISRKVLSDDNVGHFLDPEMRQLSLAGGENLTRRTLARILATPCLHLTHLSLSRCVNMTSKDLIAFFTELSGMRAIIIVCACLSCVCRVCVCVCVGLMGVCV
jgi:hypothetical protein